jgi:hypothetical protein
MKINENYLNLTESYLFSTISKKIAEKYDSISKLIFDYSQLCEWCGLIKKDELDYEIIKKTRVSECYDFNINKKYLPVSYGDIFKIKDEYYLLIGQACNLTIRENGKRTAQCATLAKISIFKDNDSNEISKYVLKYFNTESKYTIDFNNCINVDFNVLDLCTINSVC